MLKLQTLVDIPKPPNSFRINYKDELAFFGSCFSSNIGTKLQNLKFKTNINPFGVLYNPASIAQALHTLVQKESFCKNDLQHHNNQWFSFLHHSSYSHPEQSVCLERINLSLQASKKQLNNLSFLFITLGTSRVYTYTETGRIVANCHKVPAREFKRNYLHPEESFKLLFSSLQEIRKLNPGIKIILTVSPIRHWKDGAIENMRSKAALLLCAKQLEDSLKNCYYFPVYEIFMDELRDYRYYADDMLHPSKFAIEYVWHKFSQTFLDMQSLDFCKDIEKLVKMLNHKVLGDNKVAIEEFHAKIREKKAQIMGKYPNLEI